jgi:hypothetical protein
MACSGTALLFFTGVRYARPLLVRRFGTSPSSPTLFSATVHHFLLAFLSFKIHLTFRQYPFGWFLKKDLIFFYCLMHIKPSVYLTITLIRSWEHKAGMKGFRFLTVNHPQTVTEYQGALENHHRCDTFRDLTLYFKRDNFEDCIIGKPDGVFPNAAFLRLSIGFYCY